MANEVQTPKRRGRPPKVSLIPDLGPRTSPPPPDGVYVPVMFDFEMTSLNANYGRLICGSFLPLGSHTPVTYRIDQPTDGIKRDVWDDSRLAVELRDYIEKQFQIYGYNTVMFDIKFLNSRLMFHKQRVVTRKMHKDLLFTAKYAFHLSDNRLQTVQEFLQLPDHKTRLDPDQWIRAAAGDPDSINYVVTHCLTPEYRALTADLRWVALGDLRVGDKLLAFDEEPGPWPTSGGRKYRESVVEAVVPDYAETFDVELSSGQVFRTTGDHKWLVGGGGRVRDDGPRAAGPTLHWVPTSSLRTEERGSVVSTVHCLIPPFSVATDYDSGYLAGIFDGEGTRHPRGDLSFGQNPGVVLDRAVGMLERRTQEFSLRLVRDTNTGGLGQGITQIVRLRGDLPHKLRLLGTLRPERLINALDIEQFGRLELRPTTEANRVVSVRPAGVQEIVKVATNTKTLIVEGYPMHNCEADVAVLAGVFYALEPFINVVHS